MGPVSYKPFCIAMFTLMYLTHGECAGLSVKPRFCDGQKSSLLLPFQERESDKSGMESQHLRDSERRDLKQLGGRTPTAADLETWECEGAE